MDGVGEKAVTVIRIYNIVRKHEEKSD